MKAWCFWLGTTGICLVLAPLFAIGLLFAQRGENLASPGQSRR